MDLQGQSLATFDTISNNISRVLQTLENVSGPTGKSLGEISSTLPPREATELNFTLANVIVSMFGSALRCQGTDSTKHAIQKEEERLRSYLGKLSPSTSSESK